MVLAEVSSAALATAVTIALVIGMLGFVVRVLTRVPLRSLPGGPSSDSRRRAPRLGAVSGEVAGLASVERAPGAGRAPAGLAVRR